MQVQRRHIFFLLLLLTLIIATVLPSLAATGGSAEPLSRLRLGDRQRPLLENNPERFVPTTMISAASDLRAPALNTAPLRLELDPAMAPPPQGPFADCTQLLLNTTLDIVLLEDPTQGTAEPWAILDPIIYFDDEYYTSAQYSLALDIGDDGDPTPESDAFGQAIYMPERLTEILVEYSTALGWANSIDQVWGDLYTVDAQGYLTWVAGWQVPESPDTWSALAAGTVDPQILADLEGQRVALVFSNYSDIPTPGEVAWFDDISMFVCYEAGPTVENNYLPAVYRAGIQMPRCTPPSENPPDVWDLAWTRGYVDAGAICNSTLSSVDQKDYYTFQPTVSGSYTLFLRNLPAGSEWSAYIFTDTANPTIAPGNAGGKCYTSAPGSADKAVVCNLTAGTDYFVKVSGGVYTGPAAGYTMGVSRR